MAKKAKGDEPPRTKLARTKVIGGVATKASVKKVASEIQAVFLPVEAREAHRAKTRDEIAGLIFEGLSRLRGTAMKLAQVFCADTGLLPEEYLRTFEQAHYKAPGLSPALVRGVLRREFGRDAMEIFAEFDFIPKAAASLGQVHRGCLSDGQALAVKVQYPGMQDSLISDMALARFAMKPLLRTSLILSTLDQLEERLKEEVDYRCELGNLEWFAQNVTKGELIIPRPMPQLCTSRVMVMEWIDGVTLDRWVDQNPEQDVRDALAAQLLDLFIDGVFKYGRFHSDSNLGNYLVTSDSRLALLDFGSVTRLPANEIDFYRKLWLAEKSNSELLQEYRTHGAKVDDQFWEVTVAPYVRWLSRIRDRNEFDFGDHPDYVREGYRLFTGQLLNPALQGYSDQLTLAHRTLLGLFSLFTRMKARVRFPTDKVIQVR